MAQDALVVPAPLGEVADGLLAKANAVSTSKALEQKLPMNRSPGPRALRDDHGALDPAVADSPSDGLPADLLLVAARPPKTRGDPAAAAVHAAGGEGGDRAAQAMAATEIVQVLGIELEYPAEGALGRRLTGLRFGSCTLAARDAGDT